MTQPGKCHRQENLNGDSTGRTKKPTIIESKDLFLGALREAYCWYRTKYDQKAHIEYLKLIHLFLV